MYKPPNAYSIQSYMGRIWNLWNFVAKSWMTLSKWWPLMTWQGVSRLERSGDWLVADDPDVWWWRRWRAWPGHWSPGTHGITLQTIYNQSDWEKRKVWPRHLQFNSMHYNYHERLREFWEKLLVVTFTLRNINIKGWTKWFSPSSVSVLIIIMTLV